MIAKSVCGGKELCHRLSKGHGGTTMELGLLH